MNKEAAEAARTQFALDCIAAVLMREFDMRFVGSGSIECYAIARKIVESLAAAPLMSGERGMPDSTQGEPWEYWRSRAIAAEFTLHELQKSFPASDSVECAREKIYVASRASIPERAAQWRKYRDVGGIPIVSSWIDEDGPGETLDFSELWTRIHSEISECRRLVLYAEPQDFPLKGALVEVGMALALRKSITVCLPGVALEGRTFRPVGSWIADKSVTRNDDILDVMFGANPPAQDAHGKASLATSGEK